MTENLDEQMQTALGALLELAGLQPEPDGVTPSQVQDAVDRIKAMLVQLKTQQQAGGVTGRASGGAGAHVVEGGHRHVLIAGQLGIIIHQLRQAISKLGGEVSIAKDVEQAVSEYQKRDYSLVIIDLFMPTEREGLAVLEEIRRLSVICQIPTQIMVLAPPSKEKGFRERSKSRGATFFLEKTENWHETILRYYQGERLSDDLDGDS